MNRALIMSILLTIVLSIAWMLVFKPKHRSTGFWMCAACYLSLVVIYLLEHTSLGWLFLITPLSLIMGLLMGSKRFWQAVFHRQQQEVIKTEPKVKATKQAQYSEDDYFAELQRRGVPLEAPSGNLKDKPIGEILKEMERAGIPIMPRK